MENDIFISGIAASLLLLFSFKKWVMKGEIFHPGFIYSLINCGFYIIFAFGPYIYKFNLDWSYHYMYLLVTGMFVVGIILGCAANNKKAVKDIIISPTNLFFIYITLLIVIGSSLTQLTSLDDSIIATGVENRIDGIENVETKLNLSSFLFKIFHDIFIKLSTTIVTAYSVWQRRNYERIIILFVVLILSSLLANSRTFFILSLIPILMTIYTILKDRGVIDFTKISWSKNFKYTIPITIIIIAGIVLMTNARSLVIASEYDQSYEYVESTTDLQRKPWFDKFAKSHSNLVVNPIAELSMYAGSAVAHGGLITDIAMNANLSTWGLRNYFPIHRVLAQLKLDAGISNLAVKNYQRIMARATSYQSSIEYSWWGSPANFIVDFGYIGAPLISLITGWLVGWIYGQTTNSGPILKATTHSIIFMSMILTPAFGPFSEFSFCITFLLIIFYMLRNSVRIKYIQSQV